MTTEKSPSPSLIMSEPESQKFNADQILGDLGWGRFQWLLLLKIVFLSIPFSILTSCMSLAIPSINCTLGLTAAEKGILNAAIFAGMLPGCLLVPLADVFGRRRLLLAAHLLGLASQTLCACTQLLPVMLASRVASGLSAAVLVPTAFAFGAEWTPPRHRPLVLGTISGCWVIGCFFVNSVAWLFIPHKSWRLAFPDWTLESWQLYLLLCALPFIPAILSVLSLPETPKMLLKLGRAETARRVFRRIAAENRRPPPPYLELTTPAEQLLIVSVNHLADEPEKPAADSKSTWDSIRDTLLLLVSPQHRLTVLLICFSRFFWNSLYQATTLWIPELLVITSETQSGICSQNATRSELAVTSENSTFQTSAFCDDMSGSESFRVFTGVFIAASTYVLGYGLCLLLFRWVRRRVVALGGMMLGTVTVSCLFFVQRRWQVTLLGCFVNIAGGLGTTAFDALAPEIIPTAIRSTTIGLAVGLSRGGILMCVVAFRVLLEHHCSLPILLLVFAGLASVLLVFLLKDKEREDVGKTIEIDD